MFIYLIFSHSAKRLIAFFVLISVLHVMAFAQKVSISKPQPWVALQEPDLNYILPESDISGGYYYLLVDKQENISEKSIYSRFAVKIINSQGIQYMSDISAEFDPHYQKVIFNHLRIIRKGQIIDKLSMNAIKTIQRESEMERFSYDGRLTAIINLTDVRQGDIIDYSYTVTGYNPAMKGQYASELYFEYSLPVHRIHMRLLVPEYLKLNFNYSGENHLPLVSKSAGQKEYVWKLDNIKSIVYEDNTPAWYDPASRVTVSSFNTWKDVVDLFLPDYQVKESDISKLKTELNEILKSKETDKQVVEAIRFVQDHIRYLGFESGISAYIPNSPEVVFKRRYGDCKDKSLLLCAILNTIGVEARPVLVNMSGFYDESMLHPSPLEFNHCIVQVFFKNNYWYVDPTLSSQGGECGSFYVPQYGEGLVLRDGTEGLTNIDKPGNTKILSRSTFIIDSIGGNAILNVFSKYEGGQADVNRAFFESNSIDDINRYYIDYYDEAYPEIKVDGNPTFQDDRGNNIFTVEEKYLIKDFWSPVINNKEKISCSFYPLTIRSLLQTGTSVKRKMPLAIQYPADITEQIEIMLPETWSARPTGFEVENKAYSYLYSTLHTGLRINLQYKYRSKLNHVDASDAEEILSGFDKILNESSGYSLTYDTNLGKSFRFSWLMGVLALISIAVSIYFAIKVFKIYNYY
jgi:transglutaminase-like putative cysteine protease